MLASLIKRRRIELGYSQERFAAALQLGGLDTARTSVSSWETGRFQAPVKDPETRRIIAGVLQITEKELLIAAGLIAEDQISDAARRAASIVNNLPPEKQNLAINLLLTLERES